MKSKNEIIEELYQTDFVQKYSMKLLNSADIEYYDDYLGELWLMILELPEQRLQHLYYAEKKNGEIQGINGVRKFVAGIIVRQIKSKTSKLYYRYKKQNEHKTNIADVQNLDEEYDRYMVKINEKTSND